MRLASFSSDLVESRNARDSCLQRELETMSQWHTCVCRDTNEPTLEGKHWLRCQLSIQSSHFSDINVVHRATVNTLDPDGRVSADSVTQHHRTLPDGTDTHCDSVARTICRRLISAVVVTRWVCLVKTVKHLLQLNHTITGLQVDMYAVVGVCHVAHRHLCNRRTDRQIFTGLQIQL